MKWNHLYIPVLPRSLSAMLDAPMPYLCGISRENFQYAVGDIGDDTIVVDLDRNMITLGSDPVELPPLPHKHRVKLEHALQINVVSEDSLFHSIENVRLHCMLNIRCVSLPGPCLLGSPRNVKRTGQ